jgi:hypothetical protein
MIQSGLSYPTYPLGTQLSPNADIIVITRPSLYAVVKTTAVKKLKGDDLIKVVEGFRSIIINTNK